MTFGRMGARGIANQEISPEFLTRITRAFVAELDPACVAIGRDTRATGELLADAVAVGLRSSGVNAVRLGVVPTPAIQHYAAANTVPALQITASHNPPNYNGIKLIGANGMVLKRTSVQTIRKEVESGDLPSAAWDAIGHVQHYESANDDYISHIVHSIEQEEIRSNAPFVVLDPGHGAGAVTTPKLLRQLGCQVRTINSRPDGDFPGRDPEPTRENLEDLTRIVPALDADLGIAHDGDADRVIFVDENGTYIEGDTALAVLASAEISTNDVVVTALNTSQRLAKVVDNANASIEYTPIGNSYILERVEELQDQGKSVAIAGEGNGGIIYPHHRLNRDGGFVAAKFLQLVAGKQVSTVVEPHTNYHLLRDKIPYTSETQRDQILSRTESWMDTVSGSVKTMDGYRIDSDDEWVLIRPSGTEPCVRIYAEATSPTRATELIQEAKTNINPS